MEEHAVTPAPMEHGRPFRREAAIDQRNLARFAQLIDRRHIAGVDGLPLSGRPVDVTAFVIENPEPFDETAAGLAADERIEVAASEIRVTIEQRQDFDVARGQCDALLARLPAHTQQTLNYILDLHILGITWLRRSV